jgi:hypothetical protein
MTTGALSGRSAADADAIAKIPTTAPRRNFFIVHPLLKEFKL